MKRSSLAALVTAGLGLALLGPSTPARAYTGPALSIDLGKTIVVHKDPIQGVSVQFRSGAGGNFVVLNAPFSATPADCDSDTTGCEDIPVTLNVPEDDPDAIEARGYILTVVLTWDPGQSVDNTPGFGTIHEDDLHGYLYQNPMAHNSSGTATYTAETNGEEPGSMVAVSPTSKKFNLVIANFSGINNGYTLELSLTSADAVKFDPGQYSHGAPPPTYVQPTFDLPQTTPQQAGFGGSMGPSTGLTSPPTGTPPVVGAQITVPDIANGTPDTKLVALSRVSLPSGLGRHAVKVNSTVASATVAKSSTSAIVLTLLALPVLALLTTLLMLGRSRRRARAATA